MSYKFENGNEDSVLKNFETEEVVVDIIKNKRNESSKLDYKLIDYKNSDDGKKELVKDVIALLNTEEAIGEDKFIIFGIVDGSMYRRGLIEFRDDNEYQNIFDNITPRPIIGTGTIEFEEKLFGFIKILKSNDKLPYSVKEDCYFPSGTSFIRIGTTNRGLSQKKREELMLNRLIKYPSNFELNEQVDLMNESRKKEYFDSELESFRTINPSFNNGEFTIGKGLSMFKLKFQSASNSTARIYSDFGEIKIGRYSNSLAFEEIINIKQIKIQDIDFSSRVVDFCKGELAVIINQFSKCLLVQFTRIESKSHGKDDDKLSFKWKVLN